MKLVGAIAVLSASAAAAATAAAPGVENPQRAHMNYMLHCQGCHLPTGAGTSNGAPSMVGVVARFLEVEGGREYLTRVPGVANAAVSDDQLAELLNWTLSTFDAEHVPADFTPFTTDEMTAGRRHPYVSEAAQIRATLVEKFPVSRQHGNAKEGGGE